MFKNFFLLELKYTLKQPMVYIMLSIITLLVLAASSSDNIVIGGSVGNVYRNAPHIITIYTTVLTIFGLIIATAFFNNAALRDHNNQFNEILFSTPLSKAGYFFGRFFGALFLATIPMLGVFLGSMLASVLAPAFGWMDADRYGDFYLATFMNNYLLFILPNMFFAGIIIFTLAHKFKSTVISFLGALLIMIGYIVSGTLISDIDNETIGALTDIFGVRTYGIDTKYFTPLEKNTISPSFSGLLLQNRLIWISTGLVILALSYISFSFKEKKQKLKKIKSGNKNSAKKVFTFPSINPQFSIKTEWIQFKSYFFINFLSITKSVTFKILFLFSAIILISNLMGGFEYFGLQSYPITYKLIDAINNNIGLFSNIILVFFSGELIWRDRDFKINEVIDATPHTSFVSLFAKALSLVAVTVILHFFFILCGIVYQLLNGYTNIEFSIYILDFIYDSLPYYFILSGIMILIQVVLNNKYIGYFISILILFVWSIILGILDIQSNMVDIGGTPSIRYSDMNSFGPGLQGAIWFNLYWVFFSLLCLFGAGILWNRGVIRSLWDRLKSAKKQSTTAYTISFATVGVIWLAIAGYVYYNTQILNPYKTSDILEELSVEYEKKYKKYEDAKLPKVTDIKYHIDLFPNKRNVEVKAVIQLTNEHKTSIDSLHFNTNPDWKTTFNIPNSDVVHEDTELSYIIYKLKDPIKPNSTIEIEINNNYTTKGFKNGRGNTNIIKNGTFLNNYQVLPTLGYNKNIEISDKNTRKKYDLPPKSRTPELQEEVSHHHMNNYLTDGRSDFITVETFISTAKDQIAIAPGSLIKKWEKDNRSHYHYKVDQPSQNFYSFISARYEIAKRKWNDVDIEIYYDAKHSTNIEMMLDAVQRSLEYYTENFGPYYHKQCRIIEFPRYATFAQAFPGTMPYSEAFGFIIDLENKNDNNVIDAVIAHEMGHQWWAHQVIGADMQGGTMLSESFAEYSSLMTLKGISKTPMKMREFIKYDHDRYLRGRSRETEKELPLYKVENQGYIHYGKGSVILYALQDYIGEENVNTALCEFLDEFKYKTPPYPSSIDFLNYLEPKVPDSLKYLVNDWFKEITLYDNRLKESSYKKLNNGKYEVSIKIESRKLKSDSIGKESKTVINDWVDVGIFADKKEENLVFEKRVKVDKEEMEFTFEIDTIPAKAAIDPRKLLIDRVYSDNVKNVTLLEE